ncbi:hypothetical protein ACWGKQ_12775 [Streptomyces sp. NPDC054770]
MEPAADPFESRTSHDPAVIAAAVTVALAFFGYVATHLNGPRPAQRQERLARVDRRLSDLYGLLFAPPEADGNTFAAFAERHARPGGTFTG